MQHTCDCRLSVSSLPCVVLMQIALLTFLPHLSKITGKYSKDDFDMIYTDLYCHGVIPDLMHNKNRSVAY